MRMLPSSCIAAALSHKQLPDITSCSSIEIGGLIVEQFKSSLQSSASLLTGPRHSVSSLILELWQLIRTYAVIIVLH